MKFCESCGSFMNTTPQGYLCPRCDTELMMDTIEVRREERPRAEPVYEMNAYMTSNSTVSQECPRCDSVDAYRIILTTQGDHAGVKQDRSIERYTCVECNHTWIQT